MLAPVSLLIMKAMLEKTYCCELATNADIPVAGTAVQVDIWLLLEYPYAWKAKALQDNLLPKTVIQLFDKLTREFDALGVSLRVQFIRQAKTDLLAPRLIFADGRDGHIKLLTARLQGYDDFPVLNASNLLSGQHDGFAPSSEEIYLVCTNGQRDVCCSKFGRPLYSRLNDTHGDRVWQTTHIGGHRYAPNLLCLPSGYVYGFVNPDIAETLVNAHDNAQLDLARLRGRSHYYPHVQAAEIFARQQHNLTNAGAIHCANGKSTDVTQVIEYSGDANGKLSIHRTEMLHEPSACEANPKPGSRFSAN